MKAEQPLVFDYSSRQLRPHICSVLTSMVPVSSLTVQQIEMSTKWYPEALAFYGPR